MAGGVTSASPESRLWYRGLYMLCLVLLLNVAQASEVTYSARYGTALFYYFQQDYFNALSELMVGQQLDELGMQAENAELLRGGISLSFGMDRAAQDIFEALLVAPDASIDRDSAWFYLAKLAWQRGDLDRSKAALEKMGNSYSGPLASEANYLRASIELRQGDEQLIRSYDTLFARNSPWPYYLYYNLGVTRATGGDWAAATDYFHQVADSPLFTPEINSLRDKALTASGYVLLAAGNFEEAVKDFTAVRLDSPLVDRALLGYGWAYGEMDDYLSALSPWQVLSKRSLLSDSVRESLLAISYAYEKLGRRATALKKYREAGDLYTTELEAVRAAIAALREADLSRQSGSIVGVSQDWLSGQGLFPQGDYLPYLRHLMTRHSFQVALRELQDLHKLAFYLSEARQRLRVLAEVNETQQNSWSSILRSDRLAHLKERQQKLLLQSEQLAQRINEAEGAGRSLQLQGDLQELEALEREAGQYVGRIEEAIVLRQKKNSVPRIKALRDRTLAQEQQVQVALDNARKRTSQMAITELQQQAEKLQVSLGQSRLAVARLYDMSSSAVPR